MIFSIIIPVYNESLNIKLLIDEIYNVVKYDNFEIIVINDCSNDNTLEILKKIKNKYQNFIYYTLDKRSGQSFAIFKGAELSKSNTIITLDGDGQNDPGDIARLYNFYVNNNYQLLGGIRKKRKDNFIKKISSKIANRIRSWILDDNCADTGCGLKIFDRKIFLSFPFFDGIHRFLPALYKGYGHNTYFIDVNHRPRILGLSKYGTFKRTINGINDIFLVRNIIRKFKNDK